MQNGNRENIRCPCPKTARIFKTFLPPFACGFTRLKISSYGLAYLKKKPAQNPIRADQLAYAHRPDRILSITSNLSICLRLRLLKNHPTTKHRRRLTKRPSLMCVFRCLAAPCLYMQRATSDNRLCGGWQHGCDKGGTVWSPLRCDWFLSSRRHSK